ncbi:MAG: ABC transporter substrate-binding protein [Candidatus Caldarchaeum sp.]|nr:ABC transporter substrate-binding protein [Candidatus Caldarchaeum sp.]MDW8435787.1 ABC transporter substrate-binding protein [Candidatus Caldarchaeum sp.]
MRVVSLVPSATDVLVELGAVDELVGVTYACKIPSKPVVVKPLLNTEGLAPEEIDRAISNASRTGQQLYQIDIDSIRSLNPDVIFAQSLCDVCAVNADEVNRILRGFATVVTLHPKTVDEILNDIFTIGKYVGRNQEAKDLVERNMKKIQFVKEFSVGLEKIKTVFFEWLYPPFCSGHWVPELVEIAGGVDLGVKGEHSRRVRPEEVEAFGPAKVIAGPCGYGLDKSLDELVDFMSEPWVMRLPAYRLREFYAVDADTYFSRHGPSIGDAALILAEIIHPETFRNLAPEKSYKKVGEG